MSVLTGTAICLVKPGGRILLGKRIGKSGNGTWSFPGGRVEENESLEECISRELEEEVGIVIPADFLEQCQDGAIASRFDDIEQSWCTIFYFVAVGENLEAINREPHKCEKWEWFPIGDLPKPLYGAIPKYLRKIGFL